MEEDKYRFACLIPLGLRRRFSPNVQGETILILLVPEMRRELVENIEAVIGEVGKRRHRRNVRWTVCTLSSLLVRPYGFHTADTSLPNLKPQRQCPQEQGSVLARQTSALR